MSMNKYLLVVAALVLASTGSASAQQRTFYDARGHVTGRAATDSQGTTTYYDERGSVVGRSSRR
jgi:YD repeat-containing protein